MKVFFAAPLLFLLTFATGCTHNVRQAAKAEVPVVPVSNPVLRSVTESVEFTGRTSAIDSVNIVPRVTGFLDKLYFKEGSEVKKGDLLAEIDPRPYQAQLDQAMGQVKLYDAQLKLAKSTLARDLEANRVPGTISTQQIDQDRAAVEEAEARVKAYEASTEVYKLNLAFTKVHAPVDGQVGRFFLTVGNLVNQDQTLLTTVVSLDPINDYFDMDEPTLLRIRRAINEGKIQRPTDGKIRVFMGLQGENGYPHEGTVNFVNNQVNPNTGSITVRGIFANPKPENGIRLLSPGMFTRIRLPIGQPHEALLVIDRAITSDQGLKYVYVVNAESKIESRRVTPGALQEDGLRVISDGLKPDDTVVVGALPQIQPRMQVQTEKVVMPSFRPESTQGETAPSTAPTKTAGAKNTANEKPGTAPVKSSPPPSPNKGGNEEE
jgi:multidrug efflux system membrane fusion protein